MNAANIAEQFAQALDAEDYPSAEAMLSEKCEYTCRGKMYCGPSAIIESYRGNGNSAKRDFDDVRYESAVTEFENNVALIQFTDHLFHNGLHFTFACQQLIEIENDRRITRIEHLDLPGQRVALVEFMQQVGIVGSNDG